MSCHIIDHDTIGKIAAFAADSDRAAYVKYHFPQVTADTPEAIAEALAEELARLNAESVAARYADCDTADMTNFPGPADGYADLAEYAQCARLHAMSRHRMGRKVQVEDAVKALARDVMSYEYQTCEAPDWNDAGKDGINWIKSQLLGLLVRDH